MKVQETTKVMHMCEYIEKHLKWLTIWNRPSYGAAIYTDCTLIIVHYDNLTDCMGIVSKVLIDFKTDFKTKEEIFIAKFYLAGNFLAKPRII